MSGCSEAVCCCLCRCHHASSSGGGSRHTHNMSALNVNSTTPPLKKRVLSPEVTHSLDYYACSASAISSAPWPLDLSCAAAAAAAALVTRDNGHGGASAQQHQQMQHSRHSANMHRLAEQLRLQQHNAAAAAAAAVAVGYTPPPPPPLSANYFPIVPSVGATTVITTTTCAGSAPVDSIACSVEGRGGTSKAFRNDRIVLIQCSYDCGSGQLRGLRLDAHSHSLDQSSMAELRGACVARDNNCHHNFTLGNVCSPFNASVNLSVNFQDCCSSNCFN